MASPTVAWAHPIVPNGLADEWLPRDAPATDSAFILRDREEPGELVWRDAAGDARGAVDVTQLRVHGNPDGIGLFVRFTAAPPACAMIQVAIDLDRASSSGALSFDRDTSTRIRADSRAEFIAVATASGGTVRDPSGRSVGTFGAAVGADGLEMFIPWTALGRASWPVGVRLSAAAFCASDGAQPDPVTSDALASRVHDALTDYGGPSTSVRHTRDEVSDGVIDKVFALYFVTSGTIPTALTIQRVAPMVDRARGGAWFELANRTSEALSLDGYAIGDEGIAGGPDGLFALPSGITVMPGASITVAEDGAAYRAVFGRAANVELGSTDPSTPDAVALTTRGRGAFSIDLAGDEVVLFDAERTLLDAFTFNGSSFGGTTPYPALSRNVALTRNPSGLDTDDCRIDFFAAGAPCATEAHCDDRQCSYCDRGLCADRADGLRCTAGTCPGQCSVGRCEPMCRSDAGDSSASSDAEGTADATGDGGTAARDDAGDAGDVAVTDVMDDMRRTDVTDVVTTMDVTALQDVTDARRDALATDVDGALVSPPRTGCACRSAATGGSTGPVAAALAVLAAVSALRIRRENRGQRRSRPVD
jgi:MYXO-CTERM domain-containing protein